MLGSNKKMYLSDFVMVSGILLQANVVKPGIIVQRVSFHFSLILEAPLTHYDILHSQFFVGGTISRHKHAFYPAAAVSSSRVNMHAHTTYW